MYKYLICILLGIILFILLNNINGFSIGIPDGDPGEPCRDHDPRCDSGFCMGGICRQAGGGGGGVMLPPPAVDDELSEEEKIALLTEFLTVEDIEELSIDGTYLPGQFSLFLEEVERIEDVAQVGLPADYSCATSIDAPPVVRSFESVMSVLQGQQVPQIFMNALENVNDCYELIKLFSTFSKTSKNFKEIAIEVRLVTEKPCDRLFSGLQIDTVDINMSITNLTVLLNRRISETLPFNNPVLNIAEIVRLPRINYAKLPFYFPIYEYQRTPEMQSSYKDASGEILPLTQTFELIDSEEIRRGLTLPRCIPFYNFDNLDSLNSSLDPSSAIHDMKTFVVEFNVFKIPQYSTIGPGPSSIWQTIFTLENDDLGAVEFGYNNIRQNMMSMEEELQEVELEMEGVRMPYYIDEGYIALTGWLQQDAGAGSVVLPIGEIVGIDREYVVRGLNPDLTAQEIIERQQLWEAFVTAVDDGGDINTARTAIETYNTHKRNEYKRRTTENFLRYIEENTGDTFTIQVYIDFQLFMSDSYYSGTEFIPRFIDKLRDFKLDNIFATFDKSVYVTDIGILSNPEDKKYDTD